MSDTGTNGGIFSFQKLISQNLFTQIGHETLLETQQDFFFFLTAEAARSQQSAFILIRHGLPFSMRVITSVGTCLCTVRNYILHKLKLLSFPSRCLSAPDLTFLKYHLHHVFTVLPAFAQIVFKVNYICNLVTSCLHGPVTYNHWFSLMNY